MKNEGIKVCCTSGHPTITCGCEDYTPSGQIVSLQSSDFLGYLTKPPKMNDQNSNSAAIIAVYDIFGFEVVGTRRFLDSLATQSGLTILMPDFFRAKPWSFTNFPPANRNDLVNWLAKVASWEIISQDLKVAHNFLLTSGFIQNQSNIGMIGFCWGAKQVIQACAGESYGKKLGFTVNAGISVHGSFIGPEDAEDVTVPMLFMPSGEDPSIDPVKQILDRKSFGSKCDYHTFSEEVHGFAAARGNWNIEHTRHSIEKAINLSSTFLKKTLF